MEFPIGFLALRMPGSGGQEHHRFERVDRIEWVGGFGQPTGHHKQDHLSINLITVEQRKLLF